MILLQPDIGFDHTPHGTYPTRIMLKKPILDSLTAWDQAGNTQEYRVHWHRPSRAPKERYAMTKLLTLIDLAKNKNLQGADIRVLLLMVGHMQYGGRIGITPTNIAAELHMQRPDVYKTLKKLRDAELIYKSPVDANYYVHKNLAERGTEEPRRRRNTATAG